MSRLVVAMTGASGAIYAVRLLQVLLAAGREVHFTFSPAAAEVMGHELGWHVDPEHFSVPSFLDNLLQTQVGSLRLPPLQTPGSSSVFSEQPGQPSGQLFYHHYQDFRAGIASGSFLTAGMVICPCSGGTLASLATGQSQNLIHRAADVHLKERRKLILVPRETPLSSIALNNMKTLSDVGGIILPAMPGFYQRPREISDLIDFVVARICDQLCVPHRLMARWGEASALEE
ncbi:MAG: flavin prenyltransferase UbiX [Planctomycetaceae bacterium]|nr:MAG: flavin prenyltransferase UbiX [Planctomycetaceae bacterium]